MANFGRAPRLPLCVTLLSESRAAMSALTLSKLLGEALKFELTFQIIQLKWNGLWLPVPKYGGKFEWSFVGFFPLLMSFIT